jgi:hypothetical protein
VAPYGDVRVREREGLGPFCERYSAGVKNVLQVIGFKGRVESGSDKVRNSIAPGASHMRITSPT